MAAAYFNDNSFNSASGSFNSAPGLLAAALARREEAALAVLVAVDSVRIDSNLRALLHLSALVKGS